MGLLAKLRTVWSLTVTWGASAVLPQANCWPRSRCWSLFPAGEAW
jgi:hypothetical protein